MAKGQSGIRPGNLTLFLLLALFLAACDSTTTGIATTGLVTITLNLDGGSQRLVSDAGNVRQLLDEANVTLSEADLIEPPLFTPLTDEMEVTIIRVTESVEIVEQNLPFRRRNVRNESMNTGDPPIIIQSGAPGLQEATVRIVYHDGLEFSRQETQITVIEQPQDEIVMIGFGAAPGNVDFAGTLAFISGGNSVILRGSNALPEQVNTGGALDRRVFSLSPTGSHILYTRGITETGRFNTLWVVGTEPEASPRPLNVDNVLWADWNPAAGDGLQLAYTTGVAIELLPGWEANNDLWVGDVPLNSNQPFTPQQLVDLYPATYAWWGGNYAWSPAGRFIAYSHADEVGILDTQAPNVNAQRRRLVTFTEYNTQADWVWVPSLSWAPDGAYIASTLHGGDDPDGRSFETWVTNAGNGVSYRFVEQTGIWSYPAWSPSYAGTQDEGRTTSQIAFLQTTNPADSLRSSYTLWLIDRDGSNARQIYPPSGENSRFSNQQNSLDWAPGGRQLAFVYDDALYLFDLDIGEARRLTQDDNVVSNPTWAP